MDFAEATDKRRENDRILNGRDFVFALIVHLVVIALFAVSGFHFTKKEIAIPIDLTVVPPWAEQTDDPEVDPNPLPPPAPEQTQPAPPKPKADPPKVDADKVPAVEQIKVTKKKVEKKKEKPKKKEPVDLRKNAKLVKTPATPTDLRTRARKIDVPPTRRYGKATAHEKPLSPQEIQKLLNQGYRYGSRNQLAANEEQLCVSMIRAAIEREWRKEAFTWHPGLSPVEVALALGPGGRVKGFDIIKSSGDRSIDQTVQRALRRIRTIPGLTKTFLDQFPTIAIEMEPRQG